MQNTRSGKTLGVAPLVSDDVMTCRWRVLLRTERQKKKE